MMNKPDFVENVVKSLSKLAKETEKESLEHDIRPRFVKYFIEPILGYSGNDYRYEKNRTDITIFDENKFGVLIIETKRPNENIDKTNHEEQAFKYEEDTTKYIGLTNFRRLKIWEINKTERKLIIDIDFVGIVDKNKNLSVEEQTQILSLNCITKESLFQPSKYEEFDETYARIDITKEAGFKKLLERLNFVANELLWEYTVKSFGEYKEAYSKYSTELEKINHELKSKSNGSIKPNIVKYRQKIENEYKQYLSFSGFELWKYYSGNENLDEIDVMQIFCKETIYVLLNKLLFIRICEDKGILQKYISNGGIEKMRQIIPSNELIYKEIVDLSFRFASKLYAHFYETGILDWFRTGDGELDKLLNRLLWILNQFDFAHVDRDILGNLYEKYLPSTERKKLGEFYTPVEVIDYILTSVGYSYNNDIQTKDLLDPACGSGGFLVRATRRLISKYLVKFGKANKKELRNPKNWKELVSRLDPDDAKTIIESIKKHIHGFDINQFAVHIAEMNILFQIIDLYQKAREKYPDYKLGRFKIYQTDSLELPKQKQIMDYTHKSFLEEQEEVSEIKNKKFDFVVGNPPYVRVQMLDERTRKYITENYKTAYSNFDLYVVFIERGLDWLKSNGKFGYITSNQFINREYGKKLRKYILENSKIISIIDFGDSGVFKDATNYPTILIFEKSMPKQNSFKFIKVKQPKNDLIEQIFFRFKEKEYSDSYFNIFEIEQSRLSDEPWQLSPEFEMKVLNKIKNKGILLGEKSKILLGIQTGKDTLLIGRINEKNNIIADFQSKNGKSLIEKDLLKPVLRGREVRKWGVLSSVFYAVCPHKILNNNFQPIPEKELKEKYLNAYTFLKNNENVIRNRKWYSKTAEQLHGIWYSLMYYEPAKDFEKPKILTPALTDRNNFTLDNDRFFFVLGTAGVYGIVPNDDVNIKYLLGLLNSKVSEYYLKHICPVKQGGYFQYSTNYLEKLPIKLSETKEEEQKAELIIKGVDEILNLAKKSAGLDFEDLLKGKETEKLSNIASFSIKDTAKFESLKIEGNRIFINKQDFIEIKNKKTYDFVFVYLQAIQQKLKRIKNVKALIYNIEIPKDEKLLKDIGKKAGFDIVKTKERIEQLENEINELVYELYGITKEEKKIIEDSLK